MNIILLSCLVLLGLKKLVLLFMLTYYAQNKILQFSSHVAEKRF